MCEIPSGLFNFRLLWWRYWSKCVRYQVDYLILDCFDEDIGVSVWDTKWTISRGPHHQVALIACSSLCIACHLSLSSIGLFRFARRHLVSIQSCCVCVHKRMLFMSLSLLLQQCLTCLVRFTWMICEMESKLLYCWCFVGCCFQDLFKTA